MKEKNEQIQQDVWKSEIDSTVGIQEPDLEGGGLLAVTIHEGNNLKAKHSFVIMRVGYDIKRTWTMRNNQNPVWKETFKFAVKKPAKAVLRLVVCSSSWIKKSEVLGDVDISVADVVQEKHMNIYNIGNSRIHVELQWVGMPVKTKPKVLHFMTLDIGPHRLSR
ncbi:hypothetical protein E3N88_19860 [Mikania micrantha]|uniref:C2 domain-containing protein n=1 Tax=Mikania micrantha TaxID=192012 RepID=A0A5N6NQ28_9ASTR|nr:hypothetical protein E3N88_19860 [Mikania micrantha]